MKVNDSKVTCYDHVIESTSSVKYLGLKNDKFVSGEMIVNNSLSKVIARKKFMYRHSSTLSSRAR